MFAHLNAFHLAEKALQKSWTAVRLPLKHPCGMIACKAMMTAERMRLVRQGGF